MVRWKLTSVVMRSDSGGTSNASSSSSSNGGSRSISVVVLLLSLLLELLLFLVSFLLLLLDVVLLLLALETIDQATASRPALLVLGDGLLIGRRQLAVGSLVGDLSALLGLGSSGRWRGSKDVGLVCGTKSVM